MTPASVRPVEHPWCAISVDMDSVEDYARVYPIPSGIDIGDEVYASCVRTMLTFFAELKVPCTFFVVTKDLSIAARRDAVERLRDAGHELGTHSWSHNVGKPEATLRREFDLSVNLLRDQIGVVPVGYRAPAYVVHDFVYERLEHHGYLYSSSVLTTPLIFAFKLLSNLRTAGNRMLNCRERLYPWGRWQALLAPPRCYRPDRRRFWRASSSGAIVEIPLTCAPTYGYPFQYTYLARLAPRTTMSLGRRLAGKPVNFSFHLLDFISDELAGRLGSFNPNLRIPLRDRLDSARMIVSLIRHGRQSMTLQEVARVV